MVNSLWLTYPFTTDLVDTTDVTGHITSIFIMLNFRVPFDELSALWYPFDVR